MYETPIQQSDYQHLPEPIRRYLDFVGVEGHRIPTRADIVAHGEFSMDHGKSFQPVRSEQVNTLYPMSRDYHIRSHKGIISMRGRDSYLGGKGRMVIKLLGLFKVADVKGPEMDQSALVTFLDDMVFVPQWWLDPRLEWEEIDQESARVSLENQGSRASIVLHVNEQGEVFNLVSGDRYQSDRKGKRRVKWSTPVRNYQSMSGIMVPTEGEAIWHEEQGDFLYVRLKIDSVTFI